ncbi:PepSY-associated TM helix domain-containing protein [Fibrivirga algicola]|uniref:PepSY domain-containing protein n=1 Tax=Fibrivirga algicola TaxID=2950420 RepID=A0ABX0QCT3_9BACT|nr:PepSY-associated TM helix domain-containing protein [Fibrivirga algicola]NID10180.1 PepSY domain-containing protein [Fibrivirga algicola]
MKTLLHKIHLLLGLGSGAIVVIVALTGCVWAFEEEIRYVTQHEQLFVTPQSTPRVPVSQVLQTVRRADPTIRVNQIRLFGNPEKAVQVFTKDKHLLTVNPYSGQLLANHDQESDWLLINLKLHRTLLLGEVGKKIIYWNAWIFAIMLLTGFVLWLPARLKQLRASLTVKWQAKRAKRTYDLHSVLGFYAIPFLLLIVATGIDMASHGEKKKEKPTVYGAFASDFIADQALTAALGTDAFETVRINLPKDSLNPLRVVIAYPTSGLRKESTFTFDPATAQRLDAKLHTQQSFSERFWKSDYELHTGRILGLFGKVLVFLVGLVAASLPVTGSLIWWDRRQKARKKQVSPAGKSRLTRV